MTQILNYVIRLVQLKVYWFKSVYYIVVYKKSVFQAFSDFSLIYKY